MKNDVWKIKHILYTFFCIVVDVLVSRITPISAQPKFKNKGKCMFRNEYALNGFYTDHLELDMKSNNKILCSFLWNINATVTLRERCLKVVCVAASSTKQERGESLKGRASRTRVQLIII